MRFHRDTFLAGARDVVPLMLGIAPFGLITGVGAASIGFTATEAIGMSFFVFAGASQLAAFALLEQGAGITVILLTTFLVNLRLAMYSASLAPWLRAIGRPMRSFMAYLMTDHAYGVSILRFRSDPDTPKREYYLGVALPLWIVWQGATAVGAIVGTQVPPGWQLDFAIPLTFLALLAPVVHDRPGLLAAITGGVLSLILSGLPYNLGLVTAALLGITVGMLAERAKPPTRPPETTP